MPMSEFNCFGINVQFTKMQNILKESVQKYRHWYVVDYNKLSACVNLHYIKIHSFYIKSKRYNTKIYCCNTTILKYFNNSLGSV